MLPVRCRLGLQAIILALISCFRGAVCNTTSTGGPGFDPCANFTAITKGDSFTLGLMFLPGQNASALNAYMAAQALVVTNFTGVCTPSILANFAANYSARFAVFSTRVDRLQMLQIPYSDIVLPMAQLPTTVPPTMTMIAFRAGVYSDAMYVASANTLYTVGYGFATSLSLMATFKQGTLQYLTWWGTNCDACGGVNGGVCFHQPGNAYVRTCATPIENCTCSGLGVPAWSCDYNAKQFEQCNTGVQLAWIGTDTKFNVFSTGPQIQRLNSYSIVKLYNTVFNYVSNLVNSTVTSVSFQWTTVQGESKLQTVDQQSVIGR